VKRDTYEDALATLRRQWQRNPTRRASIEREAQQLLRERELAPAIAVHETGHALVAHALGYTVACVSRVGSDCGIGGHAFISDLDDRLALTCCDNATIAAGGSALAILAGLDPERGCDRDRRLVDELEHEWNERVTVARNLLLDGYEQAAMRVVAALRVRPQLDAAEFLAAVTGPADLDSTEVSSTEARSDGLQCRTARSA
jgi:hypothetical protein